MDVVDRMSFNPAISNISIGNYAIPKCDCQQNIYVYELHNTMDKYFLHLAVLSHDSIGCAAVCLDGLFEHKSKL